MEAQELFEQQQDNNTPSSEHFMVEEFFDFSNEEAATAPFIPNTTTNSTHSSPTALDSINSSSSNPNFLTADLSVPYDDLAELEWLSNFTEESFSSEDLQRMQLISGIKARSDTEAREFHHQVEPNRANSILNPQLSVPAKARSKRSRGPTCNWNSRLLVVSPTTSSSQPEPMALPKKPVARKKDSRDEEGEGRKCLHCATDKTPQWRTGPMGPKTLCNACGVRYKSGRLVPEYRPAASPTFVLTKHSNSHRKVLELRRQKEMMQAQQQHQQQLLHHHHHQSIMFDVSSNGQDYLIHQQLGPHFGHLI
ncbi:hypothetical protein HN51_059633 [Arachis hypogaea]|uniref:GATA transcription factor n=1 Tax=Arachis hypogaea TaxID=3818 RepID=A0A444X6J0_ARAHY|nr:GATA transcription factor 12 [Arachis ipaensis]XP_025683747.1 GATA transcription factor 12 [Arachis hypogaea]QHN83086.1 GATA transcription factor [Arachis hypogaea]RYQ85289.1 hypothetical protein Ahy_B10g104807 [Arachis hypogaea]